MSDWNPQIVKIEKVEKHPDADALDIATVLGDYPVIVKRDEYKEGDLAGYIPIDSIVPDTDQFYFLCPKLYQKFEDANGQIQHTQLGPKFAIGAVPEKYRIIKAKKLRGRYSQGMLVSVPNIGTTEIFTPGESIVNMWVPELKKWEEEQEENIPAVKSRGANAAPAPKGWAVPYYDLESVRKYLSCLEGEQDVILTEKLNGSNSAFVFDGDKLVIKSRNFYKKFDPEDMWVDLAIRYNLEEKLSKYPMIVLFGECINQVKNFRYSANIIDGKLITKFYCFDAYDVKKMRYLDYDDFKFIVDDLGLDASPILYRGPWTTKEEMYKFAEGMSNLNPKVIREGWVLSLGKERFEPKLNSRLKLKLISEAYNLSK
jgi:RNA ligase (TIGR02306 family)